MDEIASEIGISKTVLYRYFTDKNDLTSATMSRYVETTLAPRIYSAISHELDEYELTRVVVTAYVETVATDPEVVALTLAAPDGAELPGWHAGAHIDVYLPSGRTRHYSLCGDPELSLIHI